MLEMNLIGLCENTCISVFFFFNVGSVKIGEKVVKLKHMKQGLRSSVTCKFNISHQFLLVITDSWCVCVCM